MQEHKYNLNRNNEECQCCCNIIITIICILGFIFSIILPSDKYGTPADYFYVYIIRSNNETNINRTLCLGSYFINFPINHPQIGYEISDIPNNMYTLEKVKQMSNIQVHQQPNYDGIYNDFYNDFYSGKNVIVSVDYTEIPKLAKYLGCSNCLGWNSNPTINMTDDSMYNVTWVLRRGFYHRNIFPNSKTFEFYTVSQNLENPVIILNQTVENSSCDINSKYVITKW